MNNEIQGLNRLNELHTFLKGIDELAIWPNTPKSEYLKSSLSTLCKFSESIFREAVERRYPVALQLTKYTNESAKRMLDVAADKDFNQTFCEYMSDPSIPDNTDIPIEEEQVRAAMLAILVAHQLGVLSVVLLALSASDSILDLSIFSLKETLDEWINEHGI